MISAAAEHALLTASALTAGYEQQRVVNDVSFALKAGEFVGLAGPNGSGKTTLLHCLTGYHAPAGGQVQIGSAAVHTLSRARVARQLAFVPQFTESVYSFNVREMVLMGRYPYGGLGTVNGPEDLAMADAALEEMHVLNLRDRRFNELSGGEKQLVLLARALVQEAPIMIMDEPLTGLDPRHQFQVMQALRGLSRRPASAALATFHDLPIAARWCDRIILLAAGEIIADGVPADVITPDILQRVYGICARVTRDADGYLQITVLGTT